MKLPLVQPENVFVTTRNPIAQPAPGSLAARVLTLERLVEVLRLELISQNKKIGRLETLALA